MSNESKDSGPESAAKGVVEDVKGKVKEAAGALSGRDELRREGQAQQEKAEAQREVATKEAEAEKAARASNRSRGRTAQPPELSTAGTAEGSSTWERSQSSRTRARRSGADSTSCGTSWRPPASRSPLVRGAEVEDGAQACSRSARRRRRARVRLGRRRHGAALRRRHGRLRRRARDHPGRHREPLRVESRDPEGHSRCGRRRVARAIGAGSTSDRSTANASSSWPAPVSTR